MIDATVSWAGIRYYVSQLTGKCPVLLFNRIQRRDPSFVIVAGKTFTEILNDYLHAHWMKTGEHYVY